jgi:hypothetical protein
MTQEEIKSKIAELEQEIEMVKSNGDEELVELMMMELEELKGRLQGN